MLWKNKYKVLTFGEDTLLVDPPEQLIIMQCFKIAMVVEGRTPTKPVFA